MIIPVWKKIGQSTHLLAQTVGKLHNEKATHTGTLDPMAEGVVIVLTGEDRHKKSDFTHSKKTYQFQILFGVSTDSQDLLGLNNGIIQESINSNELSTKLEALLPQFIGSQKQTQPLFSAQRVGGKSAFDLAKNATPFTPTENEIKIYSIEVDKKTEISLEQIAMYLHSIIPKISGDFRQDEIIKDWEKTLSLLESKACTTLPLVTITAEVSKRTYIRSLVRDIGKKLKLPATTFSIVRTNSGSYSESDCISVDVNL